MKSIIKTIIILSILAITLNSCDKKGDIVYGDIGEITVNITGDQSVVPMTLLFTASAENAEFFVWDFGYKKDLNDADQEELLQPMGNTGDEVELTFLHGGTYTVMIPNRKR